MSGRATLLSDERDGTARAIRDDDPSPWSRKEIAWVVALTVAVAIAGAWHLNRASLSNDEAATWAISGHRFTDLMQVLRSSGGDRGAALYYVVAFGWLRVFGTSEVALRSLSVVTASATMVPFHAVARRLVPRSAAFAAGAILALSAFFLTYARDARAYGAAVLLVVVAAWTFLRAVQTDTTRDWWIFTVVALLAVYTQWFAALVVLSFFAAWFSTGSEARGRTRARWSILALASGTVPIPAFVLSGSNSGVDWIASLNVAEFRSVSAGFTGSSHPVVVLAVLAVLAIGFSAAWKDRRRGPAPPLVLTWFLVPVAATVMVSTVKPLLVTRYLIIALPGFALLVAFGLSRIARGRGIILTTGVIVAALLGASSYDQLWARSKGAEDWRSIAATVAQRAGPRDAIVVFPATAVSAFSYYARQDVLRGHRGGTEWPPLAWNAPFTRRIANSTVLSAKTFDDRPTVWLVIRAPHGSTVTREVRDSPVLAELRRRLRQRFAVVDQVAPWSDHDTVFVVRYSQPVRS